MSSKKSRSQRFALPHDRLSVGLLAAFIVIAIITGVVAFKFVSGFVLSWNLTNLPGYTQPTSSNPNGASTTPNPTELAAIPTGALQPMAGPTAIPWDGVGRINILVMGLDYDWAVGGSTAQRSDSMILMTLDPISKTAGMLSIPRDMWVNIPGYDYGKINTAYFLGESQQLPGGGPGLAIKTVENLLGVSINYYVRIDFPAFISFIDHIKGVKVTPDQDLTLGLTGKDQKVYLKAGETVTLDGATALAYARDRHTSGGDFDRSSRQMEVIMAVRDRILQFDMLPNLLANAPALYNDLSAGIHTNLNLVQIIELAQLAAQIPKENIKQAVIGAGQVEFAQTQDKTQDILVPIPDKIRLLRDQIFTTGGPVSPAAVAGDPKQLMVDEKARVSVQNGSSTAGLASRTGEYLKAQGMDVVEETNTNQTPYTIIIDYSGRPYTVAYLAKLMNVPTSHIFSRYDPNATIDVAVQLGSDWARQNPMPTP